MNRIGQRGSRAVAIGARQKSLWIVLAALLALLAASVPVSAASTEERVKPEAGVLITAVADEMPAAEAGLARGDILLAIDGDRVNTAAELQKVILMQDPGDALELTVKRGDEELTFSVTLADRDGYPVLGVAAHVDRGDGMSPQRGRRGWMPDRGRAFGMERGRGMNALPFKEIDGAAVVDILEDGPAAAAGLQAGDIITAIDDIEIGGLNDLAQAAANYSPGDEVMLTVERDGEAVELTVTLGAHPDDDGMAFLGVRIMPSGEFQLHRDGRGPGRGGYFRFGFPRGLPFGGPFAWMNTDGALVMGIQDEGPAAGAELQKGDLITAIGETEIAGFDELVEALAAYSPGDEVELTVVRDGEQLTAAVTLGAHPDDEDKAYLGLMIVPLERFRMQLEEEMIEESHNGEEQAQQSSHEGDQDS